MHNTIGQGIDEKNSRREFLKNSGLLLGGGLAGLSLLSLLEGCNNPEKQDKKEINDRIYFDNIHYLTLHNLQDTSLVEKGVLIEQMPTAYDNNIYAQNIARIDTVQDSKVYKDCERMSKIAGKVSTYATKHEMPFEKLMGLIMLESAGVANAGSKKGHYGYCQLNKNMGEKYGAIVNGKDYRDNIDYALPACGKYLTELHEEYQDHNWSLTFAAYRIGKNRMDKLLKAARETNPSVQTFQDILSTNTKEVGGVLMELEDGSYNYYPKLLAAGRIYNTYDGNREKFNKAVQAYIDMPISRKPALAEEYLWFRGKQYKTFSAIEESMNSGKLYSVKKDDRIQFHKIGELSEDPREKELLKMSTPCSRGLINLVTSHFSETVKISSLTRPNEYNDKIYNDKGLVAKDKWTSHATGYTIDFAFLKSNNDNNQLAFILYTLECQGKISFLKEKNHFHVVINPAFENYFSKLVGK